MVFPSHGYRGATLPVVHSSLGDLVSLHSLSCLWVSGRSRLPPQSFLPVVIGEATPLVTSFDFFGFISLHSLSYLWVSGRRHC